MNGMRLCWFDNDPPYVNESLKYIQSVFRDIRKKAKVLKEIGDFQIKSHEKLEKENQA
jgi:hypothetical protein